MWNEKLSDKLSSDLINLKPIWLKQLWCDENRATFHHFHHLTFVIRHSQHKIAILGRGSEENAYELIMEVMKMYDIMCDILSIDLINLIDVLFEKVSLW